MAVKRTRLIDYKESFDQNTSSIQSKYLVECDRLMDTAAAAAAIAAKPIPPNYWIWNLLSNPRTANPLWIDVDIEYQIPNRPYDEPNPLLRPSVLNSSYDEFTESYFQDTDNQLVTTTAGERFENFPMRRNGNLLLQITKNFPSFPAVAYDNIKYTRNQGSITIRGTTYAAGTLLFLPATVAETTEQVQGIRYNYFATTFRLLADHGTHLHKIDNRGYFEKVSNKLRRIPADDGSILTAPWPLNENGTKKPNYSDAPFIRTFKPYALAAWGIDFS